MNSNQLMAAYAATKTRFGLNHRMRTVLDESPLYTTIMDLVHNGDWATAQQLLNVVMDSAGLPKVATPDLIDAGPQYHSDCGHFHHQDSACPETPCGSYLCCIN